MPRAASVVSRLAVTCPPGGGHEGAESYLTTANLLDTMTMATTKEPLPGRAACVGTRAGPATTAKSAGSAGMLTRVFGSATPARRPRRPSEPDRSVPRAGRGAPVTVRGHQ